MYVGGPSFPRGPFGRTTSATLHEAPTLSSRSTLEITAQTLVIMQQLYIDVEKQNSSFCWILSLPYISSTGGELSHSIIEKQPFLGMRINSYFQVLGSEISTTSTDKF